eukprot:Pgem_evm2s3459
MNEKIIETIDLLNVLTSRIEYLKDKEFVTEKYPFFLIKAKTSVNLFENKALSLVHNHVQKYDDVTEQELRNKACNILDNNIFLNNATCFNGQIIEKHQKSRFYNVNKFYFTPEQQVFHTFNDWEVNKNHQFCNNII